MSARAKLFTHGGSQAVRLPKAFRFEGTEVLVRRQGRGVFLEPVPPGPPRTAEEVEAMFARMDALGESSLEYPPEPQPQARNYDR